MARRDLAMIVEQSDDAIIGFALDGAITSWNKGAQRLYGYAAVEAVGRSIAILLAPGDEDDIRSMLRPISHGGRTKPYETKHRCKSGRLVEVSLSLAPILGPDGRPIGASAIAQDISERKRAQELKDEVIAMTSHELGNPLTTISIVLGMLAEEDGAGLSPRQKEMIGLGRAAAQRMARMLSDFLMVEKLSAGQLRLDLEELDLPSTLRGAVASMAPIAAQAGVGLALEPLAGTVMVRADADRLTQVAINLLSNAIKFSPAGGRVSVGLERRGAMVRVFVCDEGPGIPAELRPRIFRRFARATHVAAAGSGLGLAISKAIIEAHGGAIGFEDRPNAGTTFYFELPALERSSEHG